MKISVIMPAYNSAETIRESINSVLDQTYKNIELLIIDDGSTDETLEIVNAIKDKRIVVYKQKHKGPGAARNFGIKKCTGDFILFCDSDDKLDSEIVKKFLKIKDVEKYDAVLFRTQKITSSGEIITDNSIKSFVFSERDRTDIIRAIYNKFLKFNNLLGFDGVCGKFIKKTFLLKNMIYYPEDILRFEDALFCKKIYQKSAHMMYMDEVGYYYIQNDESICHKYNDNAPKMFAKALTVLADGDEGDQDFYVKVLTTITECESVYFYNREYKKKYLDYKKEFLQMLGERPFSEAVYNIKYKNIPVHYKIEVFLLRRKLFLIYTVFKKVHFLSKEK